MSPVLFILAVPPHFRGRIGAGRNENYRCCRRRGALLLRSSFTRFRLKRRRRAPAIPACKDLRLGAFVIFYKRYKRHSWKCARGLCHCRINDRTERAASTAGINSTRVKYETAARFDGARCSRLIKGEEKDQIERHPFALRGTYERTVASPRGFQSPAEGREQPVVRNVTSAGYNLLGIFRE